jgi:hypothetical protein
MKVSFFHLGAAYAYIEPYLRSLGLDVVIENVSCDFQHLCVLSFGEDER